MSESLETSFTRWKSAAPSWWHASLSRADLPAPSPQPARAKWTIVGLGVAGASVAWELVQHGEDPAGIVLLDAAQVAFGASGRNAGFLLSFCGTDLLEWHQHFGHEDCLELIRLNIANRDEVVAWAASRNVPLQRGGSYSGAATEDEGERLEKCMGLLREAGGTGYRLMSTLPGPANGYLQTIHQPADAGLDPVLYAASLLRASEASYVVDAVVDWDRVREDGKGSLIETRHGALRTERIVLAANAYTNLVLDVAEAAHIVPNRNQVLICEIDGESDNRLWGDAVYYTDEGYDYWRQLPDGRLLVGGGRCHDFEGEKTLEMQPNERVLRYLEDTLLPRLTGGRRAKVIHRWQGIMGCSPDMIPIAGKVRGGIPGVSFLGGFTGYGMGFHRVVARRLVRLLLHGEHVGVFSAKRFRQRTTGAEA